MSDFSDRIKNLLKEILSLTPIKEEVNVRKLFPSYGPHDHHYDFVVPMFKLIVECHGQQHGKPVTFGGSILDASSRFANQKRRDRLKEEVARENGWGYLIVWHNELPRSDEEAIILLKSKVLKSISEMKDR
jgi:G:T-mismatch repair DNA endonuclease (very short patch repair protein)